MGAAARHRRIARMKYSAKLADEDTNRFDMAWEKRLSSWLEQIKKKQDT